MGGGALTVYLTQEQTRRSLPPGQGAVLGLLAGVLGAGVWLVVYSMVDLVLGPLQQRMITSMLEGSIDVPPEARQLLENLAMQAGSPLRFVVGFAVQLLTGVMFGAVGGLLGAVYFRRDVAPALGGDPIEPPPIPE